MWFQTADAGMHSSYTHSTHALQLFENQGVLTAYEVHAVQVMLKNTKATDGFLSGTQLNNLRTGTTNGVRKLLT